MTKHPNLPDSADYDDPRAPWNDEDMLFCPNPDCPRYGDEVGVEGVCPECGEEGKP